MPTHARPVQIMNLWTEVTRIQHNDTESLALILPENRLCNDRCPLSATGERSDPARHRPTSREEIMVDGASSPPPCTSLARVGPFPKSRLPALVACTATLTARRPFAWHQA